jgi:hypothetical protein
LNSDSTLSGVQSWLWIIRIGFAISSYVAPGAAIESLAAWAVPNRRALVVIHKCLREAVVLAGMPEPRHREVKLRVTQIPVPSMALDTGICRYDDSEIHISK